MIGIIIVINCSLALSLNIFKTRLIITTQKYLGGLVMQLNYYGE
jgi:hypothetical protein